MIRPRQTNPKGKSSAPSPATASWSEILSTSRGPEFPESHLTMAQMKVLMLLGVGGEARMSDLAHQLGISPSTLSRRSSSGWSRPISLSAGRTSRDRRNVLVSLTSGGVELLDTFQELGIRHLRELLGQLDEEALVTVNKAIDHLVAAARRISAEV